MSNQVVKVKREAIAACMRCPLCNKLLRDATTVSECLHTFCRRCIYKKLSDEEFEYCPICNIDLGCVPLEKLRPDHNLEDVRAKIFPFKRRKVKAPEAMPLITLPVRRKERSLSSLVVSTPRVSTQRSQTSMTGRRTKPFARRAAALRSSTFPIEKSVKKDEDMGDPPLSSSSPETLTKFTQNIRQKSSTAEPSSRLTPSEETENGSKPRDTKVDLWKPLNCLVEVANRKSFKCNSQGSTAKADHLSMHDNEAPGRKVKAKEQAHKTKVHDEKNSDPPQESIKPKKSHRICRKKPSTFRDMGLSPQVVLDASGASERRIGPVWFSLVASEDQEGDVPLPQIPAHYLRIKDGSLPVSFIQKYLVKKLDLTSEAEVEIKCMGQPVLPELQMHNLIDLWLQTTSTPRRIPASIGSSAKDFVMVLGYARKLPAPS